MQNRTHRRALVAVAALIAIAGCDNPSPPKPSAFDARHETAANLAPGSLAQVEIEEVVSFTCPHCYRFQLDRRRLLEKYGDRLVVRTIAVARSGDSDVPLRLYNVARILGKEQRARELLFDYAFARDKDIARESVALAIADELGIRDEYVQRAGSDRVAEMIRRDRQRAISYGVHFTPAIVIEKRLVAGGDVANLDTLIAELLVD